MAEKIRWGIMGTANIALEMVRAINQSSNGQVAAVASRSSERAAEWARGLDIPHSFGSYEDMLKASGELDAIYIPLPNSLHAAWTIRALEAGFPVLCEKPLASNLDAARQVVAQAHRSKLPLAEGFMYRFHPLWEIVMARLESGAVGDVKSVDAQFSFLLDEPDSIVASADLAGGALLDVGCYCVHLARWIAGQEPQRVFAFQNLRQGVDESMVGLFEFPSGLLARMEASVACAEQHRVVITGTSGSLVIDRPWVQGLEPSTVRLVRWEQEDELISIPGADAYGLQVEHFAGVCLGRAQPIWSPDDALANMAVIDALVESAGEGMAMCPEKVS